ncbi:pentapeptide repeat-containing protein [Actinomadura luteofluorescens]
MAYRKQHTEENAALREDTKLHSDRFTAAVTQLGDTSPAVQLGGYTPRPPRPTTPLRAGSTSPASPCCAHTCACPTIPTRVTIPPESRTPCRTLPEAIFTGATVSFRGARFVGSTVNFGDARFEGGTVDFGDATGRRPEQLPGGMADHLS